LRRVKMTHAGRPKLRIRRSEHTTPGPAGCVRSFTQRDPSRSHLQGLAQPAPQPRSSAPHDRDATSRVDSWHEAAIRKCPLLRRLWGLSGHWSASFMSTRARLRAGRIPKPNSRPAWRRARAAPASRAWASSACVHGHWQRGRWLASLWTRSALRRPGTGDCQCAEGPSYLVCSRHVVYFAQVSVPPQLGNWWPGKSSNGRAPPPIIKQLMPLLDLVHQ